MDHNFKGDIRFATDHAFSGGKSRFVLVQPEMERGRSPLVVFHPSGGDFQGIDTTTRLSCVTTVKERPTHDFKGLTRGGRPLSRWKFPVAGAKP